MATTNTQQAARQAEVIDLGRLLGLLLDGKWWILGITSCFTLAGILYALCATPVYKVDALVQVEQKSGGIPGLSEMSDLFDGATEAATEIELIKSRMVLGKTVDELQLDIQVEPERPYGMGKGLADRLGIRSGDILVSRLNVPDSWLGQPLVLEVLPGQRYRLLNDDEPLLEGKVGELASSNGIQLLIADLKAADGERFVLTRQARLKAINDLLAELAVAEKGKKTGIMSLSLTGADPELIRRTLDEVARNYVLQNVERNAAEAEKSLSFLQSHLPEVRSDLDRAEQKLNDFRLANDSVDLGLEAKAVLDTLVQLEAQLNELTFKESDISQRFTPEHPAYIALREKRQTLLKEKSRLNQQIQKLPKTQQEVLRLTRDAQVGQQIYLQLLNKVQELNIVKAGTVGNVRIIDGAELQPQPVKPKKSLLVVIATLLGGMLSVALVLVRAALNRGIESPDELEALGINVYASIPLSEWQQKQEKSAKSQRLSTRDALLAANNPADLSIEALRSLRTSLHFAMLEAKNKVLVISGPSPEIGKSFVSANLGAVVATAGQKVLIIDADLRKGHLQRFFNGSSSDTGLSDYLAGSQDLAQLARATEVPGLDFIGRGQIPPNPSELLMHPRFGALLAWANEHYDLVLVDTPPLLAVTDAAIVARQAGTTLLVARHGVNPAKEVDVTRNRFAQNGIEVKGVILNAVERKAGRYYGYGNYGYYQYSYASGKR